MAELVGVAVVVVSLLAVRLGRVPSGLIKTGGYGADLWAGLTGVYAAGLAFAVLPLWPGSAVAALVAGGTAAWIVQTPRRAAAMVALAVVAVGAAAALLSVPSRLIAGVVAAVLAALAARRALGRLTARPGSRRRLPDAMRGGPWQRLWLVLVGVAVGLTTAAPAEESGVLLMLAALSGAVTFAVLVEPTEDRPGTLPTAVLRIGLGLAAVPGVAVVADLVDDEELHAALLGAAPAVIVAIAVAVRILFRELCGPFHEPGPWMPVPYGTPIAWVWIGAVLDHSASIVVRPRSAASIDDLGLQLEPGGVQVVPLATPHGVARFHARRLRRDTRYTVTVRLAGQEVGRCTFRTFGPATRTIRIAAASCASTGSNGRVFDAIAALGPDVFCHLGDLHYENIGRNDPGRFRRAYDDALSSPAVTRLMSRVPVAYVFDDHDFGKNNSNRESASRAAALRVYRERVPHYGFGADDDPAATEPDERPIYQRFQIGPVLVVLTDTRSERDPEPGRDSYGPRSARRLIGEFQERWLCHAPAEAARRGCDLVVWCSSTPWIGRDGADPDTWSGFPDQRRRIAEALLDGERKHGVRVVVVSGDAHMVGLDGGRADRVAIPSSAVDAEDPHADPLGGDSADDDDFPLRGTASTGWQARVFPAMNAAALDRPGSHKGAHYGHYERPGAGQFGVVEVDVGPDGRAARARLIVSDVNGRLEHLTIPLGRDEP